METEKRDLVFDGQQRMEEAQSVQDELDKLRAKLDKVAYCRRWSMVGLMIPLVQR